MPYTSPQSRSARSLSPAERISFLSALGIVACIVALVLYAWASGGDAPPVLVAETGREIRQASEQFYVPFTVTNRGGRTVQTVQVVAQFREGDRTEDIGTQEIDFLSRGESRSGAFVLDRRPDPKRFRVRVAGYKLP